MSAIPTPDHSGYRLTRDDERRIRAALADYASELPEGWSGQAKLAVADTATRVAASAIGCGLHDLREVEISWITTAARRALIGLPVLEATLDVANRALEAAKAAGYPTAKASHNQTSALAALRAARIAIGEIDGSAS